MDDDEARTFMTLSTLRDEQIQFENDHSISVGTQQELDSTEYLMGLLRLFLEKIKEYETAINRISMAKLELGSRAASTPIVTQVIAHCEALTNEILRSQAGMSKEYFPLRTSTGDYIAAPALNILTLVTKVRDLQRTHGILLVHLRNVSCESDILDPGQVISEF